MVGALLVLTSLSLSRQIIPASTKVMISQGEELTSALEELRETVDTLETRLRRDFSGEGRFFGGTESGLLDVVFAPSCIGIPITGEVLVLAIRRT